MSFNHNQSIAGVPLIKAQNISKNFRLGEFISLKATIYRLLFFFKTILAVKTHPRLESDQTSFKALNNISVCINAGERVGIVGLNGAGKSTLLKIISGIMSPSIGNVEVNGRLIPLLGVGAGFDQELTGRENILLYGVVLGLTRSEIAINLDNILSFADIGPHIDTPVKRYSKGMKARLGMSIAFNLRPDILVVDEVLAVGDLNFRTKCMEKINEICDEGVALLFVSHSLSRLKKTTDRCLLIRNGQLIQDGPTDEVLNQYIEEDLAPVGGAEMLIDDEETLDANSEFLEPDSFQEFDTSTREGRTSITSVSVLNEYGELTNSVAKDEVFVLKVNFDIYDPSLSYYPRVMFFDANGHVIFSTTWPDGQPGITAETKGPHSASVNVDTDLLAAGRYLLRVGVYSYSPLIKHDQQVTTCGIIINEHKNHPDDPEYSFPRKRVGYFHPKFSWKEDHPQ